MKESIPKRIMMRYYIISSCLEDIMVSLNLEVNLNALKNNTIDCLRR